MYIKYIITYLIMFIFVMGCSNKEVTNNSKESHDKINEDKNYYVINEVNVRESPEIGEDIIHRLNHNEKVKVIDKKSGEKDTYTWFKVSILNDQKGWVNSKFLSENKLPSKQEYFELISEAEKLVVEIFSAAFQEELFNDKRIPFSEHEPDLKKYYADDELEFLKKFYENYLMDWGYEMGYIFPLYREHLTDIKNFNIKNEKIIIEFKLPADPRMKDDQQRNIIYYIKDKRIIERKYPEPGI